MKINKKIIIKSLSVFFSSALIAAPIFSCTSNINNNSNNVPTDDNSQNTDNNNSGDPSIVSDEISNSSKIDSTLYNVVSSFDGAIQNTKDFLQCGDFSGYKGEKEFIYKDVYIYFYKLSQKYKNLTILNPRFLNLTISNPGSSTKDLILNKSDISFMVYVDITSIIDQNVVIANQKVSLVKNKKYQLLIDVNNAKILPMINYYQSENYLSWSIEQAQFYLINGKQNWTVSNFSFNEGMFSHAFLYKFNNLFNGYTYFDLKEKYNNLAYDVSSSNLKETINSEINKEFEIYSKYIDYGIQALNIFKSDVKIDELKLKLSPSIIDLLIDANLIPNNLKNFLNDAIKNNSNFIDLLDSNTNQIASFIAGIIGTDTNSIESILNSYQAGDDTSKIEKIIDNLFSTTNSINLNQSLKIMIIDDILGGTYKNTSSNPKKLVDVIFDNYQTIFSLIENNFNHPYINTLKEILNLLSTNLINYTSFYDLVLCSKENKMNFFKILKSFLFVLPQLEKMLDVYTVNDLNMNKENFLLITNSFANLINGFFATNENYTSIENKYKNLNVSYGWTEYAEPQLDKDKTITFEYKYSFKLKQSITFDLTPFKKLVNDDAAQLIYDDFIKQYQNSTGNMSEILGKIDGKSVIYAILNFLPNEIVFGKDNNKNELSFSFVAENNTTWFEVIENKDKNYNMGFGFGYNMNISYDDPNALNSITLNFENKIQQYGTTGYYLNYSDVWRQIISNFIFRSYSRSLKGVVDSGQEIATSQNYSNLQVYSKYSFTDKTNLENNSTFLHNLIPTSDENNYQKVPGNMGTLYYQWKNSLSNNEEIWGYQPSIISDDDKMLNIKNQMFNFNWEKTNATSLDYLLNVNINDNADILFKIKLFANNWINAKFSFTSASIDLYFPFKVLNKSNNKLVDSIHADFSYSNFNVSFIQI